MHWITWSYYIVFMKNYSYVELVYFFIFSIAFFCLPIPESPITAGLIGCIHYSTLSILYCLSHSNSSINFGYKTNVGVVNLKELNWDLSILT